ncbi:hypothetical protein BGZ99_010405 [Dissophora globulifera]|uniref:RNI-like protein n=1 Tax=Dissophora globulifera TaxID=979702 RepID=A0A9P6R4J5_9FUNG|nr:hypothetical protein BGZ99_010405 [Dissophora globulifera]
MSSTTQTFKFGSSVKRLDLISPETTREPQFIYVDDVLQVFQISGRVKFESDDLLSVRSKVSRYVDPSEPLYFGSLRESIMQIPEDIEVATNASLIVGNRSRKMLDTHFIVDGGVSSGYDKSIATHAITNSESEIRVMAELKEIRKEVMEELKEIHRDVKDSLELAKQMNDRLIMIQSKADAILTQSYELHEFTIPRLFIVLPETLTSWDPMTMLRTKFRLHFICECDEHTKPAKSTKALTSEISHELHLAMHEGYVVRKPTEFFKKYGPFLMVMLEVLKHGTVFACNVVPGASTLRSVTSQGIDYSLKYLEEIRTQIRQSDGVDVDSDAETLQHDLTRYLAGAKGLEGADLRQLGSYLTSSDNLMGNLYRMTTQDGHVKWVCHDHYRTGYQEEDAQNLRDVVNLARGEFDEQLGRITIALTSGFAATEFYKAVRKGNGVLELVLNLNWACDRSDLEELKDTLMRSRVSILRLSIQQFRASFSSILLSTSTRYEVFFRIRELPNMKMIHVVLPKEIVKLPNYQSKKSSHRCKLSIELVTGYIREKELGTLVQMLKTDSVLTILDLGDGSIGDHGTRALSEALKTNLTLTNLNNGAQALSTALKTDSTLTTLNLQSNLIREKGVQALSEALKTNSVLITLNLQRNSIDFKGALALILARRINSTLTTLNLQNNAICDRHVWELSEAFKTNSSLTTLDLVRSSIGTDRAQALSEALKPNFTLTTLNLGYNSIGDNGAQALSTTLKTDSTLTTLNLESNLIRENGAQALSEVLKTNSTLTTLNLEQNPIGSNGAKALSEALKTNSTLTTLNLLANFIGDNGAQALSEALKTNSTLTNLNLGYGWIGDNGAQALSEALKINSTLTTLNLWINSISDIGAQAFSETLKTNSTLTALYLDESSIEDNRIQALRKARKTNSTLATLTF